MTVLTVDKHCTICVSLVAFYFFSSQQKNLKEKKKKRKKKKKKIFCLHKPFTVENKESIIEPRFYPCNFDPKYNGSNEIL